MIIAAMLVNDRTPGKASALHAANATLHAANATLQA